MSAKFMETNFFRNFRTFQPLINPFVDGFDYATASSEIQRCFHALPVLGNAPKIYDSI